MRSRYADYFNHDDDAPGYDRDVADETNPLRAGYRAVLDFIGSKVPAGSTVLDLGAGTGNTILALPPSCRVTAVDVSARMLALTRGKLTGRDVTCIKDDILGFVDSRDLVDFTIVTSTYALHHLTPEERGILFRLMFEKTRLTVKMLIGDIMYENDDDKKRIIGTGGTGSPDLEADFQTEFFWNVEESDADLKSIGWNTDWKRYSDLSWAVELDRI